MDPTRTTNSTQVRSVVAEVFGGAPSVERDESLDLLGRALAPLELVELWLCGSGGAVLVQGPGAGAPPNLSRDLGGDDWVAVPSDSGTCLFAVTLLDGERRGRLVARVRGGPATDDVGRRLEAQRTWIELAGGLVLRAHHLEAELARAQARSKQLRREYDLVRAEHTKMQAMTLETLYELDRTREQVIQQERLHALAQMAGGVAHDLNNTLVPIVGYSQILCADPALPDGARRNLEVIQTAANDAAAVVGRLREFAGPRPAMAPREPVELGLLVQQAIDLTRAKWHDEAQRSGRPIQVEFELEPVPSLSAHPAEIREVLTNLILNAVDAMPQGGRITLRSRTEPQTAVVEVQDTGIGMTDLERRRCFEPFYTTKGARGSGLGLSVCHGIIQRHGGSIEVESERGRGTTFRVRLPIPVAEWESESAPLGPSAGGLRPGRVLYIDDDPRVREVVGGMLAKLGQEVDLAEDGQQGVELFRARAYDAVITDLGMPVMDGFEVIRQVRQTRPEVPVILLTGWSVPVADGALQEEADYVLDKPVTLDQLRTALAQVYALRS